MWPCGETSWQEEMQTAFCSEGLMWFAQAARRDKGEQEGLEEEEGSEGGMEKD